MIFTSFDYNYTVGGLGSTDRVFLFDLDFRSLYQIDPNRLVFLKYASIAITHHDAAGGGLQNSVTQARLIGNFNESRNIDIVTGQVGAGQTLTKFDGITFSMDAPFIAPHNAEILMPAIFQLEFRQGQQQQNAVGDSIDAWFTIGYDIQPKNRIK